MDFLNPTKYWIRNTNMFKHFKPLKTSISYTIYLKKKIQNATTDFKYKVKHIRTLQFGSNFTEQQNKNIAKKKSPHVCLKMCWVHTTWILSSTKFWMQQIWTYYIFRRSLIFRDNLAANSLIMDINFKKCFIH